MYCQPMRGKDMRGKLTSIVVPDIREVIAATVVGFAD